ncbi:MAG: hypothetical protein PHE53_03525 [Thermoguttaceae bacterium]|nr:hypothetical protein [Thermoguttaceae bacterium]
MRGVWKRIVLLATASVVLWGVVGGIGCWQYLGGESFSVREVWYWSGLAAAGCAVGNLLAMMVTVLVSRGPSKEPTEVPLQETDQKNLQRSHKSPLVGLLGAMFPQMGVPLTMALIVRVAASSAERTFFLYAILVTWLPLFALETVLALRWLSENRKGDEPGGSDQT